MYVRVKEHVVQLTDDALEAVVRSATATDGCSRDVFYADEV